MKNLTVQEIKKVDEWLNGFSQEALSRLFKVTKVLKAIGELRGEDPFKVPYDALDKTNLDRTSQEAILIQLWRKSIVKFAEFLQETSIQTWENEEDISFTPDTLIFIDTPAFEYVHSLLPDLLQVESSPSPTPKEPEDHQPQSTKLSDKLPKRALQKGLNNVKKKLRLINKEKKLLEAISDFKPHKTPTLLAGGSAQALSQRKIVLNTKLERTGFYIKTLPGDFSDPKGSYQLKYSPALVREIEF